MFYYIYLLILMALAVFCRRRYTKFRCHHVKHYQTIPLLGNALMPFFHMTNIFYHINRLYLRFPEERFVGYFHFLKPVIYVKDLELIRKIAVEDADYFADQQPIAILKDPLLSSLLFTLEDEKQKLVHTATNSAYKSLKLKDLTSSLLEVTQQMVSSLKQKIEDTGKISIEINTKCLSSGYANDVLASCVFGVKVDSISEADNEFYRNRSKTPSSEVFKMLTIFGYYAMPRLMKKLKVSLFSKKSKEFYDNLVVNVMKEQKTQTTFRSAIIQLLTEAKEDKTGVDSVGRTLVSFFEGVETTSTAIKFLLYELAVSPDVQEKLFEEIEAHRKANNSNHDYDSVMKMTYLDMVVSELLRLWPPKISSVRICIKDYNLGKPNAKLANDYIIKAGECLAIPICAIHHDGNFFPDPQKFNPERFSKLNKSIMNSFAYMPFGIGPRNCIGPQFALAQMKLFLYHLLQDFVVVPSARTTFCPILSPGYNMSMLQGHWIRLKLRSKS